MTQTEIIWKILTNEYSDDHSLVYLYCCGNIRTPKTALDRSEAFLLEVFSSMTHIDIIKATIKEFFETKKQKYKNGLITLNSTY